MSVLHNSNFNTNIIQAVHRKTYYAIENNTCGSICDSYKYMNNHDTCMKTDLIRHLGVTNFLYKHDSLVVKLINIYQTCMYYFGWAYTFCTTATNIIALFAFGPFMHMLS